jgi:hypothetical protein
MYQKTAEQPSADAASGPAPGAEGDGDSDGDVADAEYEVLDGDKNA